MVGFGTVPLRALIDSANGIDLAGGDLKKPIESNAPPEQDHYLCDRNFHPVRV